MSKKKLLIVGPLPPPIGGSPLTVKMMVDELIKYPSIQIMLVNTSPSRDPRKKMTGFNGEKVKRVLSIVPSYTKKIKGSDAVLVFSNNLFNITTVPILLFLARYYRKQFYIKPVGGDLDLYIAAQTKIIQELLFKALRSADGILAQTKLLQEALARSGCSNVYYIPGCRTMPKIKHLNEQKKGCKLIFLAHISRDKGPLVLIEALQLLLKDGTKGVSCDFYGPVHDEIREEFFHQLEVTPNARYCGVAEVGTGSQVMADYDALVLPTYFACEGHPGVIIEAMQTGIPVISTKHRAIPELITEGENGLLVPILNSNALALAIKTIASETHLRDHMGKANYQKGLEFRTEVVVAKMLEIIFPTS